MTPPAVFTAGVAVGMIVWELAAKLTEARPRRIPYPSTLVRRSPRAQRVVVHFLADEHHAVKHPRVPARVVYRSDTAWPSR
jgi:hypothetical protein